MSSPPRKPSPIAEPVLGADLTLALSYVPTRNRGALKALFAIDAAMGDVLRTTGEPTLGAIRLAWWRETLEQLDGAMPPPEPRLRAVATEILPRGVAGRDLAALEGGWRALLEPFPWELPVAEAMWFRGRHVFGLGARLLGQQSDTIAAAGRVWALVDAARHCSDAASRAMLIEQARTLASGLRGAKFPPALRPLSMLGALATADAARGEPLPPEGTPWRAAAMLGHRLTGRFG